MAIGLTGLDPKRLAEMDEALELVEVLADSELEGLVTWLVRVVGLLVVLAGIGLWLLTDMGLFVLPAVLVLVGLALLAAPTILVELAG